MVSYSKRTVIKNSTGRLRKLAGDLEDVEIALRAYGFQAIAAYVSAGRRDIEQAWRMAEVEQLNDHHTARPDKSTE